jgi:tRNA A37 threonylcarbamoyladenosine dehydratase
MGTGNKLDPSALEIADIYKTSVCPLARVMRRELKKRGIDSLKVVYSKEPPISPLDTGEASEKRSIPGSAPFVPPAAGLLIAAEVVKEIALMF